jgi:putative MATE family efflux protein
MTAGTRPENSFAVTHRMVLGLALPVTLGFLTIPLLGITDTAVAGRLGDPSALAGLAIGAVLFDLIFGSFNFLRASTTALVAQAWGREDRAEQEAVFWRALATALVCGVVIILAAGPLRAAGLWIMAPDAATASATTHWFLIRALSVPAGLANFAIFGYLLGRAQARIGLFLQILINAINIVLTILLGLRLGYGIEGIAWATVTAEITGAAVGLMIVIRPFRARNPFRVAGTFATAKLKALFVLNADILIRTFVLIGAFFILTRIGAGFGPVTLAANAVLMNFFMISGFWLDGLANSAETIIGRSIGAKYRPAFERGVWLTGLWSAVLAAVLTFAFFAIGNPLIDFLTTVPEVRTVAYEHLPWAALTAVCGFLAFHMDGVFIGATWSHAMRNRMLMAFAGYCLALAVLVPAFGNHGLWASLNVFLVLRGLLLLQRLPGLRDGMFGVPER